MRVEVRRVPGADGDDAAPLRRLGQGAPGGQVRAEGGPRGEGRGPLDDVATGDGAGAGVRSACRQGHLLLRLRRLS